MSSSTEIWRHLPSLFHLTFGKTHTVIEQLRQNSSAQLTLLRLVGVEGNNYNRLLGDALKHNTTLQKVHVCGTFLATLPNAEAVVALFQAIGGLPNLIQLTLHGTEDSEAFGLEALTKLIEANNNNNNNKCGLQAIVCKYVDFVVETPTAMEEFGKALDNCTTLQRVQWQSLDFSHNTTNNSNNATTTSTTTTLCLDPVLKGLSHCKQVEIGLRHRLSECRFEPQSLQTLVSSSNLQKLALKRHIALDYHHMSAILQCLTTTTTTSGVTELQLDEIHLHHSSEDTDTTAGVLDLFWNQLADMLKTNRTLQVLDLGFSNDNNNNADTTTIPQQQQRMNPTAEQAIASSLKHNTSLKSLVLLGAFEQQPQQSDTSKMWLQLLQHDNYTLEELEFGASSNKNTTNNNNNNNNKIQFYLQLNGRQPILDGRGLRGILREYNGAIPQDLIPACVEAALNVGSGESSTENMSLDDDEDDDDLWDCSRLSNNNNNTEGLSGLFYLLSQQPSLVLYLQQQMTIWEQQQQQQRCLEEQEEQERGFIPIGGASPQLMLLDDDIVALW